MATLGGGSDPDSDIGGDGAEEDKEEEVEEEVIEVEEDEEEAEEEEEADGGDEEAEEGEEEGEEAADEILSEEENGDGEEEEEQEEEEEREEGGDGEEEEEREEGGGSGADSPPNSPAPANEDVDDDASQRIKSEGKDENLKLLHVSTSKSALNSTSNTLREALLEKQTSAEILNAKDEHEILGDQQPPSAKDSASTVKPESLLLKEKELVEVTQKRCRNGDLDDILHPEKEDSNLDRPGSQMAGFLENCNKRPAVACAFFARGWCIKGSSCRFLHQKDEDIASQAAEENLTGTSSKRDFKEDTGLKHELDRFYTPHEPLTSTAENSASESLQRALVRAYGGHELPEFNDKDSRYLFETDSSLGTKSRDVGVQLGTMNSDFFPDRHRITYAEGAGIPGSGRPSFQLSEFPKRSLVQAEDAKSYDASFSREKLDSHFNSIDRGPSMTGGFISGKYLGEGKVHHELTKMEYANDGSSIPRGSPVMKNTFIPEYKYCSSTSLMSSSIYLSSSTPNANGRGTPDSVAQYQSVPSLHESNTSYHPKGLFNSSLQDPPHVLHSGNSLTQNAFYSTRGSIPLGSEDVGTYKRLDYERAYHGLGSSSPLPQFGPEKFLQQEIAGSTLVSAEKKVKSLGDAWEPSIPFRSSFYCPAASVSSPGSQYDPLSDSIEPSQNLSNQHKGIDDAPKGSHSPGYNDLKLQISFHRSHESIISKSNSKHRADVHSSSNAGVSELHTLDGVNRNSMLKEKSWSPGHVIDVGNMKETDYEDSLRTQEEKGRHQRETKALKNFRASLVEFVKDLVKPAWREGHMSKDAHKMVVKKAAEKVLSALQPHQIPSTMDAINQYLSASRPKILKLVEGYVDKYAKS